MTLIFKFLLKITPDSINELVIKAIGIRFGDD